jgi:hypothetical protein
MFKINFNILRSFSSSDIFTIYLHEFLRSLHPFEKNCVQDLSRDFRQNNPNTNKEFRWSLSAMSHQLSFGVAKKGKRTKSKGAKSGVSLLHNRNDFIFYLSASMCLTFLGSSQLSEHDSSFFMAIP